MSFRRTLAVCGVAGLALSCSDGRDLGDRSGVGAGPGETGLHLQLSLPFNVGVARVKFEVVPVDCGNGMPLPWGMPGSSTGRSKSSGCPAANQELGGQPLADGSIHDFADLFMVLDPGCYDVTATPSPPEICQPAHAYNVRVPMGRTAEVFLVSQCQGQGRGAIDVATAFNRPPVIRDVSFAQSKFTATCEVQRVCATAVDVDQDPLEFDWRAVGDAPAHAGPRVVSTVSNPDGSVTQCAELVPHTPGAPAAGGDRVRSRAAGRRLGTSGGLAGRAGRSRPVARAASSFRSTP
jgi:hypothetical protein